MPQIPEEDFYPFVLGAVRYTLSRRSLRVVEMCNLVRKYALDLEPHHRQALVREIELQERLGYPDPASCLEWRTLLAGLRDLDEPERTVQEPGMAGSLTEGTALLLVQQAA